MGFSTSAVYLLLLTTGITLGGIMVAVLEEHGKEVQGAAEEQSREMRAEIHTDIRILGFSPSNNVTYDFWTGQRVNKWAAEKPDEPTNPPSSGPFIINEVDLSDPYNDIRSSNDVWADVAIANDRYAIHHFLFTISENPATIFNLSVLWEGYGEYDASYVYIWNYASSAWELIGVGASTASDNVVTKDLTVNAATPADYIDSKGYLHLVATSYRLGGPADLLTDYVRVFVSTGGLWVKNTGETTLDPAYVALFDSGYVASSMYSLDVDGGYWDPGEVLRISYNPSMTREHLLKVTTGNGVSASYYYAP